MSEIDQLHKIRTSALFGLIIGHENVQDVQDEPDTNILTIHARKL